MMSLPSCFILLSHHFLFVFPSWNTILCAVYVCCTVKCKWSWKGFTADGQFEQAFGLRKRQIKQLSEGQIGGRSSWHCVGIKNSPSLLCWLVDVLSVIIDAFISDQREKGSFINGNRVIKNSLYVNIILTIKVMHMYSKHTYTEITSLCCFKKYLNIHSNELHLLSKHDCIRKKPQP